jgi:hypothetical protein
MSLTDIAAQFNRSEEALKMKLRRMRLPVLREKSSAHNGEKKNSFSKTTTTDKLNPVPPNSLPSALETMQLLWAAVSRLKEPAISGEETKKLRLLISALKTYSQLHMSYLIPLSDFEKKLQLTERAILVQLEDVLDKVKDNPERRAQVENMIRELQASIEETKAIPDVPKKLLQKTGEHLT